MFGDNIDAGDLGNGLFTAIICLPIVLLLPDIDLVVKHCEALLHCKLMFVHWLIMRLEIVIPRRRNMIVVIFLKSTRGDGIGYGGRGMIIDIEDKSLF